MFNIRGRDLNRFWCRSEKLFRNIARYGPVSHFHRSPRESFMDPDEMKSAIIRGQIFMICAILCDELNVGDCWALGGGGGLHCGTD